MKGCHNIRLRKKKLIIFLGGKALKPFQGLLTAITNELGKEQSATPKTDVGCKAVLRIVY
jgi:uracil-DNA glycosylase